MSAGRMAAAVYGNAAASGRFIQNAYDYFVSFFVNVSIFIRLWVTVSIFSSVCVCVRVCVRVCMALGVVRICVISV